MRLIETSDLKRWADTIPARSRLPYFIKKLICAVIEPKSLRMPSGDAIWLPGVDGEVLNGEDNRFVPKGLSVWELGTDKDIKKKANKEYKKRSKGDYSNTTFVFVTPREWPGKADWETQRKSQGIWHDVRTIDGVDLQDWLEFAPAVSLQLAAELGRVPEKGLETPEEAWSKWSRLADPPVSEDLVVACREEQEKALLQRLAEPPNTFVVRGDSPREAWGFTLAVLHRISSEEERFNLEARTIVVDSAEVAEKLQHFRNLVIIIKQPGGQVSGFLSSKGCHVVVPVGTAFHGGQNAIILARPTHQPFVEALRKMGLSEDDAERSTRSCGRSVTILQRQRAQANYERPGWAEGSEAINLLPALLAGRWDDRNDDDKEIIRRLADSRDYYQYESLLRVFLNVDESPIQKIGEIWSLTAPADIFHLIAHRLTRRHLELFKTAFCDVFGRIDPKVEIPPDQWLYHDSKGDRGHSDWLRSGMTETLLLIAERGNDAGLNCVPSAGVYAEEVVQGIPGFDCDWRVLASIRDQYALLTEAAPRPFLHSLNRLLETKPDDVRRLFAEGEGIFGGGAMHTGLLWGLEVLAWSKEFLPQVALALAKLAGLDPGGRIGNRPINSLREIFLWWNPGTNATLRERIAAIDLILNQEPKVGWQLISMLLPTTSFSSASITTKPVWRDFGDLPDDARTRHGQAEYISAIVDRAIERLGSEAGRWNTIFETLQSMNPAQHDKIIELLRHIADGETSTEARAAIWEKLRDFIYRQRRFPDTHWALSKHMVDRLEAILPDLAPIDPVECHRWLFDDWLPDLPEQNEDMEYQKKQVEKLRREAVQEILEKRGMEGLISLGTICKYPGFVAEAIVPAMRDRDEVFCLLKEAISVGENGLFFTSQISGKAFRHYGEAWRILINEQAKVQDWSPGVVASLLILWPDEKPTWENVSALGNDVDNEYWKRKIVSLIEGSPEDQTFQIEKLITADRAAEAFDRVAVKSKGVPTETLIRLFDAAFDDFAQAKSIEDIRRLGLNSYDTRRFLDELRKRTDLNRTDLAIREYRALPILQLDDADGLSIHEFMAEDPDFFVDVLCAVFLPAGRDKSKDLRPTAEEQARARAAYRLLGGMKQVPGQNKENQIDEEALLRWIDGVRKKAIEVDRVAVADEQIGEILAHAPKDPEDSGWPHRSVRNAIERRSSEYLERGLIIERHNIRGAYTKALYEGGVQERELAAQYRCWAEIAATQWPRVTSILRSIAQNWEKQAQHEDEEAEQRKLRE